MSKLDRVAIDRTIALIKSELERSLENQFLDEPLNQSSINQIGRAFDAQLRHFLHELGDTERSQHIEFEVIGDQYSETVTITPKNFFTALLMKGIYYLPALWGATEYETEHGWFKWDSAGSFGFLPKQPVESITLNITVNKDGGVTFDDGKGGQS